MVETKKALCKMTKMNMVLRAVQMFIRMNIIVILDHTPLAFKFFYYHHCSVQSQDAKLSIERPHCQLHRPI